MSTDQSMDVDEFLEHFGIQGQRWGVRRNNRANTLAKVGLGKGTTTEKIRALGTIGPVDFVRGHGLKGGASRRGNRQLSRNSRVQTGESSVKDKIVYYGGTKYQDIIPTKRKATNTHAAVGASIAGAILLSIGANAYKKLRAP